MRYAIRLITLLTSYSLAQAVNAATVETTNWTVSTNIGFVSDYYARGISQTWHRPALQGGFDFAHRDGFYTGVWGSSVTPNTFPDANVEIDIYAGFNGTTAINGLAWTVGLYGYLYPGGSWKKYDGLTADQSKPTGGRWDTYEINTGLTYHWLSAKLSYTLTNWFGAEKATGWNSSTKGSSYIELNANYPLAWHGLTLVGHLGHLNVDGHLQSAGFPNANGVAGTYQTSPDYTDYKFGLSQAFNIAKSIGWNAGLYYVGANDNGYWDNGYGGTSFNRSINSSTQTKNLSDGRLVMTVTRTF